MKFEKKISGEASMLTKDVYQTLQRLRTSTMLSVRIAAGIESLHHGIFFFLFSSCLPIARPVFSSFFYVCFFSKEARPFFPVSSLRASWHLFWTKGKCSDGSKRVTRGRQRMGRKNDANSRTQPFSLTKDGAKESRHARKHA